MMCHYFESAFCHLQGLVHATPLWLLNHLMVIPSASVASQWPTTFTHSVYSPQTLTQIHYLLLLPRMSPRTTLAVTTKNNKSLRKRQIFRDDSILQYQLDLDYRNGTSTYASSSDTVRQKHRISCVITTYIKNGSIKAYTVLQNLKVWVI